MNTVQQYKMAGYMRGLTKVARPVSRHHLINMNTLSPVRLLNNARSKVTGASAAAHTAGTAAWRNSLMNKLLLAGNLLLDVTAENVSSVAKKPTAKPRKVNDKGSKGGKTQAGPRTIVPNKVKPQNTLSRLEKVRQAYEQLQAAKQDKPKKRRTTQLVNVAEGFLPYTTNVRPARGSRNKADAILVTEAVPKQVPADDVMEQLPLFNHMPDGSLVPALKARQLPGLVRAQARAFGMQPTLAPTQQVTNSTKPWYSGFDTYDWNGSRRAAALLQMPIIVNPNPAKTRRRFRAWLRDMYNKHPKMVIGGGATAAGAGTTALIAALLGGDTATPALSSVGPAAEHKLPERIYDVFNDPVLKREPGTDWNWHKRQLYDTTGLRGGQLALSLRLAEKAGIPKELRFRAALLQSFLDPNKLSGDLFISLARLKHAAREQALAWLDHVGIAPNTYNMARMQLFIDDYMHYKTYGGVVPDIRTYFSHLGIEYAEALNKLLKWQKALTQRF